MDFYQKPVYNSQKDKRSTFHGDDEDYQYPWHHRYFEPDSDRGASDENYKGE